MVEQIFKLAIHTPEGYSTFCILSLCVNFEETVAKQELLTGMLLLTAVLHLQDSILK